MFDALEFVLYEILLIHERDIYRNGQHTMGFDDALNACLDIDIEIPPGIHDGQRIRLSGEGHAGFLGGRAGDLYVAVRVRPDPRFVRDGNDVISTVDLTMTQAALGASVIVPTLDGDAEMTFKPGTQPGEIHGLRGKGMPVLQGFGRGDHRVLVNVVVPQKLSRRERELLQELDEVSEPAVLPKGGQSVFGWLRERLFG
jgi:molecular chaperone DnaJ